MINDWNYLYRPYHNCETYPILKLESVIYVSNPVQMTTH